MKANKTNGIRIITLPELAKWFVMGDSAVKAENVKKSGYQPKFSKYKKNLFLSKSTF